MRRYLGLHALKGIALLACLSGIVTARAQQTSPKNAGSPPKKILIPFDFESQFDEGRYGRIVGDLVWKKLAADRKFIIPESMLDVRDWSERTKKVLGAHTPLESVAAIVRDQFGGQLAIWGSVERVPGQATDVYDFSIIVADFSDATPRVIHQGSGRTKTVSEIPHVYVKAALDTLLERPQVVATPAADPVREERWLKGENLVAGEFESGSPGPRGWDALQEYTRVVPENATSGSNNHVLRFTIPPAVAESSGVLYYSDYFPVEANATYRFQTRWRTTGSAVKVFVKCYDELPTKFSQETGQQQVEYREVYRSQQNLQGPTKVWNLHTEDFTPRHTQFVPKWGRVMLYAYYPAGTVDWDDVIVKQIVPAPQQVTPALFK